MAEGVRIEEIELSKIKVGPRERVVTEEALAVLSASYDDQGGFTTPIHVRKTKDGYELIDGAHRVAVAQRRKLETILARVWTCSKKQARFLEVDANVSTADLTPVALARSLAVRHEAYVQLHPETAAGTAGGLARQGQQTTEMSFAEFVAEARGISLRHIQRIIKAGRGLSRDEAKALEAAPRRVTLDDLSEMAKINEVEERDYVIRSLVAGEAKKAAAARKAWLAEQGKAPTPPNPTDKAYKALCDAWSRAPKRAQLMFLEKYGDDVATKLADLPNGAGGDDD